MSRPRLRIAILGCGSAGPAAAILLARAGHSVQLFERAPALGAVGTGFILQPTGLAVLEELGIRSDAEAIGSRLAGLTAQTARGRTILDLRYERLGPDVFGLGMHRASLLELLVDRVRDAGVELVLGSEILSSRRNGDERFIATLDHEHGPYDLVVVANGARSAARHWIAAPTREDEYRWGAFWTIVPDPGNEWGERLFQVVDGTGLMLGLLPTGARLDDPDRTPLVSVFWSLRRDRVEATKARGAEAILEDILRLEPRAESVLCPRSSDAREIDAWSFAEYLDVVMPRWHAPGLVVLGDAAHATSPQLGQGVNLALWDARTLASAIEAPGPLDLALARYSSERRRHLAFYQLAARWLTPFFQSDSRVAGRLRDLGLPILARSGFFDRQMIATMAGVKDGLFSRLEEPGLP